MIEILDNVDDKTIEAYKLFHQIKNAHTARADQIPQLNTSSDVEWVDMNLGVDGEFYVYGEVFYDTPHLKQRRQLWTVVDGRIITIGAVEDVLVTTAAGCPVGSGTESTASSASSSSSSQSSASSPSTSVSSPTSASSASSGG